VSTRPAPPVSAARSAAVSTGEPGDYISELADRLVGALDNAAPAFSEEGTNR